MSERGIFVAIEGGDGSGKGTQAELLTNYFHESLGMQAVKFSFPQYGKPSAYFASRYLNGEYGAADAVHPELASLAYAVDRLDAKAGIEQELATGNPVILDRYVASNMAHQGAKISDSGERHAFYNRVMELEYGILGIPRPDKNIVLLVPSSVAQTNVDKKAERSYTSLKRDIHEADANHLELAKANYEELCELYPDQFTAIDCMAAGSTMRSIAAIGDEIRGIIKPLIKERR